ncbi:NADAR family protein [Leifsonia sp. Leaf264]|uniref:NADAR family protein n=1 Tax=Leifsonia sp. Leaf264 TaxID=1736314 RepID=UPI0006FA883F|nr:NADAR family protein [Leifsonia sp. Leaf264]KQO98208.1 hypothetical protein ASF30_09105 [Leifsonia sp. Leaf264]
MAEIIPEFVGQYRFLSNFHVEADGKTVEHRFQAAKATTPEDHARVMAAVDPNKAKYAGRSIQLRTDWEQVKVQIMVGLLQQKFADPELRQKLADTGTAYLQEGNHWNDRYWGVDRKTGIGRNVLGHSLMLVRATL